MNLFVPFNVNTWNTYPSLPQFLTLSGYGILGMLVLIVSQLYLRSFLKFNRLTVGRFLFWFLLEVLMLAMVMYLFYGDLKIGTWEMLRELGLSLRYTGLVILLPYSTVLLYLSVRRQRERLRALTLQDAGAAPTTGLAPARPALATGLAPLSESVPAATAALATGAAPVTGLASTGESIPVSGSGPAAGSARVAGFVPVAGPRTVTIADENQRLALTVNLKCLLFLKSEDNYVSVFSLRNRELREDVIRTNLKKLERELPTPPLLRTHRSYMVNIDQLAAVNRKHKGYEVWLEGFPEGPIPVSAGYKEHFERIMG